VKYEYDTNGLLAKEYQNSSGAVSGASLYVGYTYDTIANGLRTIGMQYPSGKTLSYDYDTIGNVTAIKEGGTPLVSYQYSGRSVAQTTYSQPGLTLDLASGLDRFGRIAGHAWKKNSTDVVRIQHGYDRVGNRTYRNDLIHANNSETYTYDGVNQIKSLNRVALAESWDYDATGNWLTYDRNNVAENRTHNTANEIQTTCVHDKNGNMTVMSGLTCKYDAWNRLVEVGNTIRYDYNGLNQRVRKTVSGVTTTSFFNSHWQELDSVIFGTTTSYIWGLRYIDDLILRERGGEKLYSLADPNWNVVATTDALGMVQERMRYDAFGNVTWLDSAFVVKANSDDGWNRTFTGQVLDAETDLMLYRNRYYHTGLGRFITRDPIGYAAGDVSLYRYVRNAANKWLDSMGLSRCGDCRCGDEREPEASLFVSVLDPEKLARGVAAARQGDVLMIASGLTARSISEALAKGMSAGTNHLTGASPSGYVSNMANRINNHFFNQGLPYRLYIEVSTFECKPCFPAFRGSYWAKTAHPPAECPNTKRKEFSKGDLIPGGGGRRWGMHTPQDEIECVRKTLEAFASKIEAD